MLRLLNMIRIFLLVPSMDPDPDPDPDFLTDPDSRKKSDPDSD